MSGLDLSKCKKISQDDKMAMFHHPDGHEIKIAVVGLSPAMKKQLEKLPLHKAEGGDMEEEAPAQAVPLSNATAAPQAQDVDFQYNPNAKDPTHPFEEQKDEKAEPAPQQAAPKEEAPPPVEAKKAPVAPVQPVEPVPLTPDQEAAKQNAHDLQFADDLKYGKITPKTYHDLYADKSVLGKVGTIFGLMLSGVGSGITGQPNALLGMMDRQIAQDLEAQKQNQANKQSWYGMSMQHEMNQPQIAAKWAEASQAASKADFDRWTNTEAHVIDMSATNNARNAQTIATVQSLQDMINKMPPGPQRDAAQAQQDNVIVPHVMQSIMQRNQETASKKAAVGAANPLPVKKANPPPKGVAESGKKYDAVNEGKLNAMIQKGKFAPGAPDAIPPALLGEVNKEKTELATNRNNLADADDSFTNLANLPRAGQAPAIGAFSSVGQGLAAAAGLLSGGPIGGAIAAGLGHLVAGKAGESAKDFFERNRAIQVEALKSRLGGNMSEEDKNKLANALLPSWTDTPASMAEAHRKMVQHFESNPSEVAPNLTRFGLKYDLPKYAFKPMKQKESKATSMPTMPPINLSK